jgi:hypothetical protein
VQYAIKTVMVVVLCGLLLLAGAATAGAQGYEGVSVRRAAQYVRAAERDVARAKAALRESRTVANATRTYSAQYGSVVGRWVWLASDVGWPNSQWPTLFYVIHRESGGYPGIMNSQGSGAAGLLQLMPGWYCGDYYSFPDFNPRNPRLNLYYVN